MRHANPYRLHNFYKEQAAAKAEKTEKHDLEIARLQEALKHETELIAEIKVFGKLPKSERLASLKAKYQGILEQIRDIRENMRNGPNPKISPGSAELANEIDEWGNKPAT